MKRLMMVAMVGGVMSLGATAHGESVVMEKAVNSCIAETMSYQREGLSDKEHNALEARVNQECRLIVQRECADASRPLCQHFSGMQLVEAEQTFSHNNISAAFTH